MLTQPQWLRSCEIAMALALCSVFGLDPESDDAIGFIRYTYREGRNVPEGGWNENLVYITYSSVSDPSNSWASTVYTDDGKVIRQKTVPLSCLLTFYGPNSTELAEQARSGLMLDAGYGSPRYVLRESCLVPVGWPDNPVTLPEVAGGIWRMRSDLRLRLSYLQTDTTGYQAMEKSPELTARIWAGDTSADARLGTAILGKAVLGVADGVAEVWRIESKTFA